jgi:hypothetical protein
MLWKQTGLQVLVSEQRDCSLDLSSTQGLRADCALCCFAQSRFPPPVSCPSLDDDVQVVVQTCHLPRHLLYQAVQVLANLVMPLERFCVFRRA